MPRAIVPVRGLIVTLVLMITLCLAWCGAVLAESAIEVISAEEGYAFSDALFFSITARSSEPIERVILFYGRDEGPLVRRIYPEFSPGKKIQVEHVETLERGQFAPGTSLRSWWRLETKGGEVLETAPHTMVYTDDAHDWQVISGAHVDLHWYGDRGETAKALIAAGEQAIERLQDDIGVPLEHKISVYVYNSERDMSRAVAPRSEAYDERVTTLGIAVGDRTLLLLGPHRDAEATIAHELSHVVVGIATDNPYTDLPRWLDEGLAMYAEGELPANNERALQRAIRDDALFSIRSMSSYPGQSSLVDPYYGQVYSVVEFMLDEFGAAKMRELLAVFADGSRQEDALAQVYGLSLEELDNLWRESLGLKARQSAEPSVTSEPETPSAQQTPVCGSLIGVWLVPVLGGLVVIVGRIMGGAS